MALLHWIGKALPELNDGSYDDTTTTIRQPLESVTAIPDFVQGVACKDIVIDENSGLSARIFLPESSHDSKLPLFIYFHGGGFLIFSSKFPFFHCFCESMARKLKAMVVSVDYRLAPEHRLPAAYQDAAKTLEWLQDKAKSQSNLQSLAEDWVSSRADLSRVFISGDSSGGNIAQHAAMDWFSQLELKNKEDPRLVKVVGIVLIQPFYGGMERKESEVEFGDGEILTLEGSDLCWKYALPAGADRDHPFCNQVKFLEGEIATDGRRRGRDFPPLCMVIGRRDCLYTRQIEAARLLQQLKPRVHIVEYGDAPHAFYLGPPSSPPVDRLFDDLFKFVTTC